MVRRPATARFAPNAWVFPGGLVEVHDGLQTLTVPTQESLGDEALLPYKVAAVRECLEETGLACLRDPLPQAQRLQVRQALHRGEGLAAAARAQGGTAELAPLHYVSFWTTPPFSSLRYSTRFFLAAAPADQGAPEVDGVELKEARWVVPAEALSAHRRGDFYLLPPQIAQLRQYTDIAKQQGLLDWAATRPSVMPNGPH